MAENEKLNNVAVDNDVGTMEDVDAIMKKYDRESNTRVWEGTPRKILRVLTALFGIFLIVMNMWIKMDERARRANCAGGNALSTRRDPALPQRAATGRGAEPQ